MPNHQPANPAKPVHHDHDHAGGCCGGGGGGGGGGCGGKGACGGHHHHHDHDDHDHDHDHDGGCCGHHDASEVLVFSRDNIRELDRLAVSQHAMPSILMMENAARGVAGAILSGTDDPEEARVLIVCGTGNNGGDGLATARHLLNAGMNVAVLLVGSPDTLTPDARTNYTILRTMDALIIEASASADQAFDRIITELGRPDLIADALLGTGTDRPVAGNHAQTITRINSERAKGCTVLAIDLPSGMDADTGHPVGGKGHPCVHADLTVTLAGLKKGFLADHAAEALGQVLVVDIGVPIDLLEELGEAVTLE